MQTTQLYEMVVVRHGLMLVGQPFSGKTSSMQVCSDPEPLRTHHAHHSAGINRIGSYALQVLAAALTELAENGVQGPLFARVQTSCINPKAVTMGQLYGELICLPPPAELVARSLQPPLACDSSVSFVRM